MFSPRQDGDEREPSYGQPNLIIGLRTGTVIQVLLYESLGFTLLLEDGPRPCVSQHSTISDITSSDLRERGKYVSKWYRKEVQISHESGVRVA